MERSTAGAFSTLFVGYILMTVAPSITFLLPAVGVRSLGSATLWVYSTLLLQYRVENRIQGWCYPPPLLWGIALALIPSGVALEGRNFQMILD